MNRSAVIAVNTSGIPEAMKQERRWVMWRLETRDGKHTKVPCTRRDAPASSTNPETWTTFDQAVNHIDDFDGIGYVLGDGYLGIDYDHVHDADTGEWQPGVLEEIRSVGSYAEISPSGTGAHVICRGTKPGKRSRGKDGVREMYDGGRYFTVTGNHIDGTPKEIRDAAPGSLEAIYAHFGDDEAPTVPPQPRAVCSLDDDTVIDLCTQARNGSKFTSLWNGDTSNYGSSSEADLALCSIVAFYTQDGAQIERIVKRSGLYRDKWDRDDYLARTIDKALAGRSETYSPIPVGRPAPIREDDPIDEEKDRAALPSNLAGAGYRRTDAGNSERLVYRHGDNIRYIGAYRNWLVWDEKRWVIDEKGTLMKLATETARSIFVEAGQAKTSEEREALAKWAIRTEALGRRQAMIEGARHHVSITPEELDARPEMFNVQNGTVDLDTGIFREHRREDLLTKLAGIAYDSTATCPLWQEHLTTIFDGEQEIIDIFQTICGYNLLQYNPEQIVFILWGSGKNGKSETLKVLALVMGDYAVNIEANTLMDAKFSDGGRARPDVLALKGARLVTCTEPGKDAILSESLIKSVTGDHAVTARPLYGNPITFKPGSKIFLGTNHLPKIKGTDEGIWRRIWLFPFVVAIPSEKRIRDYGNVLFEQEGSGIFNWMIAGLKRYQEIERLDQPMAVQRATQEYRIDMNPLGQFLRDGCVVAPRERTTKADLYHGYCEWCNGLEQRPLSQKKFSGFMKELLAEDRSKTQRYWVGVRLKTEPEKLADFHAMMISCGGDVR